MKRAIYVGTTPMKRVGPRDSELYLGFGMTGMVAWGGAGAYRFDADGSESWWVEAKDLYFPRG